MNDRIIYAIAKYDARYKGVNDDGTIIIDDEDGLLNLTPAEFVEYGEVSLDEEFIATVNLALTDLAGVNLVSANEMTDLLLDLRNLFFEYKRLKSESMKRLMDIAFRYDDDEADEEVVNT